MNNILSHSTSDFCSGKPCGLVSKTCSVQQNRHAGNHAVTSVFILKKNSPDTFIIRHHINVGKACQEGKSRMEVRGSCAKAETHPHTSATDHHPLLPTTVLARLEWRQMCDLQTLPLSSPYFSHGAQQTSWRTALRAPGQSVITQSHHLGAATDK